MREIERKFLVDGPPETGGYEGASIRQGYLVVADSGGGIEVRLRCKDGERLLTIKAGEGEIRAEEEMELDPERFARLWPLTEGRRVEKERFLIPHGELDIELDIYSGALEGLVVAEVEFPDKGTADRFESPAWFGTEVTDDHAYRNATLATEGDPR